MAKEDLIPFNELSEDEHKKIARKGGKKSGQVRKQKRMMKDTLQMLLDLTLKDGEATSPEKIKSLADIQNANLTVDQAILFAQIKKAVKGDTQSAVFIRDTSGNKLAEEVKVGEIDDTIKEIEKYVNK